MLRFNFTCLTTWPKAVLTRRNIPSFLFRLLGVPDVRPESFVISGDFMLLMWNTEAVENGVVDSVVDQVVE